jgi:hypothetical protein
MNTLNNSSSESMKSLTQKVLNADLASRKKRAISIRAIRLYPLLAFPIIYYTFKVNFFLKKFYFY